MASSFLQQLRERASALGFDLSGVTPADAESCAELEHFSRWVEAGYAGDMQYLKSTNEAGEYKRENLRNALPWAKSAIVCATNYNTAPQYSINQSNTENGSARGWISRYAWTAERVPAAEASDDGGSQQAQATDYHDTVLARLRKLEAWLHENASRYGVSGAIQSRCYVDTGPIIERVHAKYAGLGWIGKNTCLINQQLGSWIFLSVIVTSIPVVMFTEDDALALPPPDRCGTCTRCLEACPTQAFTAPYQMDATRCIAYLTIEKRGTIPEELRKGIGRHVFGCDICQDVCPWNRKAPITSLPEFGPRPELVNPELHSLAKMTREEFRKMFRGSPIERTKYSGLRRNVAIAIGNSGDASLIPVLEEMAQDEDPVVAEHADWGLKELQGKVLSNPARINS
jgi:epoxyqueuosine reductase